MTKQQQPAEQQHFEQQLQRAYQQSKTAHPLPRSVKKRIVQYAGSGQRPRYQRWFRQSQLALGSIFLAVLGYLLLQPVTVPMYQIAISYQGNASTIETHSLSSRSVPAMLAPFSADESQQRYQQMLQAQLNINEFYAEVGVLRKVQEHWHISNCEQLVVAIDPALLAQLKTITLPELTTTLPQTIEFYRGPQGQLLAIKATDKTLQCPLS